MVRSREDKVREGGGEGEVGAAWNGRGGISLGFGERLTPVPFTSNKGGM
jgi:hypothetical protein